MEINAGTDRMTRNERRKPHNEQADPQLKSAVLWGPDSAPGTLAKCVVTRQQGGVSACGYSSHSFVQEITGRNAVAH